MGTAIAATCLRSAYSVVICDTSEQVRNQLSEKIVAELIAQSQNPTIVPFATENVAQVHDVHDVLLARTPKRPVDDWQAGTIEERYRKLVQEQVQITDNLTDLVDCELIIEAIPEKKRIKHKLYQQLHQAGFAGILVSNTSTIEVSQLVERLENDFQERFCVFHVFHPVRKRSLVEIVRSPQTAKDSLSTVLKLALDLDKHPIIVGDRPGFLVNRLLQPVLNESLILLQEGVPLENIEWAALHFGMQMGPFRILDEIGLDVALHSGWSLGKALPHLAFESPILLELIESGHLGRKTGIGFKRYSSEIGWDNDGIVEPTWTTPVSSNQSAVEMTLEQIAQRLFLPMIVEAIRSFEEGIVAEYAETDIAAVLGLGFPASRGGPCYFADSFGLSRILELLQIYEKKEGARFTPPQTLLQSERGDSVSLRNRPQ